MDIDLVIAIIAIYGNFTRACTRQCHIERVIASRAHDLHIRRIIDGDGLAEGKIAQADAQRIADGHQARKRGRLLIGCALQY